MGPSIACPRCGNEMSSGGCPVCGPEAPTRAPLPAALDTAATGPTVMAPPDDRTRLAPDTPAPVAHGPTGSPLVPGQSFGPRYRITRVLGVGGMGAVYQAFDAELGIPVALKVIRPEAIADPYAAAELEQRFKRELLLAREVTHKNVVRIHDLGEIDHVKYITMSYVDGEDLGSILRARGVLPVNEALDLARQLASGLQAAHEAGVVHRDLKPANVMVDRGGHVLIMDFGIARLESGGTGGPDHSSQLRIPESSSGTTLGAVVGTLEYMAPEQARGQQVDHRADVYAFGLILRDMLAGLRPARDPVEDVKDRIEKGLPPLREVNAALSAPLEQVVSRCLEVDPAARFQTTSELCAALSRLDADGQLLPEPRRLTWKSMGAAVLAVAALLAGAAWLLWPEPPPAPHEPVSVLVADFDNRTGDPLYSGAVEEALSVGLEGASFVSVYPISDARALMAGISPGAGGRITEEHGRLLATREGLKVLVAGRIDGSPRGIRLAARLIDPSNGAVLAAPEREATKADVLVAVARLAADVRVALGEARTEAGRAETFTASSLEAVREYRLAQELQAEYKDEEADAHYRRAVQLDPDFGRAYAAWAYGALRLGRRAESAELWKKALSLTDKMTEREKYRTLGVYFGTVTRDFEKAIENYATLVRLYPADDAGYNNLALAYFSVRNFDKALENGKVAVRLYPRQPLYRNNAALYAMYAGDFTTAAGEAATVARDKPDYYPAYLPLAIAAAAGGKLEDARGHYRRMAGTNKVGASIAALGLADLALYEGRSAEAVRTLEAGLADDARAKIETAMPAKRLALAEARLAQGKNRDATRLARSALEAGHGEEIAYPAARILIAAGAPQDAGTLAQELGAQLEPQKRAYGQMIVAELAFSRRQFADALEALRAGLKLADLWIGHYLLGRLYIEVDRFAEAVSELEACVKRRGEATALFLDDLPTMRYLGDVPYWLGRAHEGIGVPAQAQADYATFLRVRASGDPGDALATDARRRLAGSR